MDARPAPQSDPPPRAELRHRVSSGAQLQIAADGVRIYTTACTCGWRSEDCGSAVLAEAAGEQHMTMSSRRRIPTRDDTHRRQ